MLVTWTYDFIRYLACTEIEKYRRLPVSELIGHRLSARPGSTDWAGGCSREVDMGRDLGHGAAQVETTWRRGRRRELRRASLQARFHGRSCSSGTQNSPASAGCRQQSGLRWRRYIRCYHGLERGE